MSNGDDPKPAQTTFLSKRPDRGIVTSSRLKAWWLTRIRGYTVLNVRHVPKKGIFGQLKYDSLWFLDHSSNGKHSSNGQHSR